MVMIDVPVCVKRFATQGLERSTTCHMFVLIQIRHESRHNNDFVFDKLIEQRLSPTEFCMDRCIGF